MPLLQFLAFYQVIEFYFPTYYQAEANRKIRAILKDPTFRSDRDADLGRILGAIQLNRSGGFGDERSHLKATLVECVDADGLRQFLEENEERKSFLSSKAKGLTEHKLPIANPGLDLRNDVADRIYDIRCKIVHTKSDSRDGEVEQAQLLSLPGPLGPPLRPAGGRAEGLACGGPSALARRDIQAIDCPSTGRRRLGVGRAVR